MISNMKIKGLKEIKSSGISTLLLICFLTLSLIPSILLASYSYISSKTQIKSTSLLELSRVTKSGRQELFDWLDKNERALTNLAADESVIYGSPDSILNTIQMASTLMPDAKTLFYAPADGIARGSYYGESDVSSEYFYKKAMQGEVCITSVRSSIQDGEKVFVIAVPVKPVNKTTGVIAAEYPISKLSNIIKHGKFGDSGFVYLIDAKGFYITHPDQKKIMKPSLAKNIDSSLLVMSQQMMAGKSGCTTYLDKHDKMIAAYGPIGKSGWSIASVVPEAELYKKLSNILLFTIIMLALLSAIIFLISIRITQTISHPIVALTQASEALATGDLSVEIPQGSFAELGRLEHSMTGVVANTAQILQTISRNMQNLVGVVAELKHSSIQSARAASEVSQISEQIASGSEETADAATNISASVETTCEHMKSVTGQLQIFIASSDNNLRSTKDGKATLLSFSRKIDEAQQGGNIISNMMGELSKSTEEIKSIAGIIAGISDQTNLLALNAAIEAARAGQHGAGFAVVAEEVRKLSDATRCHSKGISDVIKNINAAVARMTGGLVHLLDVIADQQQIGNKAITEFSAIEMGTLTQGELIREIGKAADESLRECEQVSNSIQTIAGTCQQEAASAQAISVSMQELREITCEMDAGTCKLDALMESLQTAANRFVLGKTEQI